MIFECHYNIVIILCAQLKCDLLAIAKFLVLSYCTKYITSCNAIIIACHCNLVTSAKKSIIVVEFLPRDAMHKRGLRCRAVSVRLAAWVSVTFFTFMSCVETAVIIS